MLANNAWYSIVGSLEALSIDEFKQEDDTNFLGLYNLNNGCYQ